MELKPETMKIKSGTMLDHQKKVLQGVSVDKELFKKELVKSFRWLEQPEKKELIRWVNSNFRKSHPRVLDEVFATEQQFIA